MFLRSSHPPGTLSVGILMCHLSCCGCSEEGYRCLLLTYADSKLWWLFGSLACAAPHIREQTSHFIPPCVEEKWDLSQSYLKPMFSILCIFISSYFGKKKGILIIFPKILKLTCIGYCNISFIFRLFLCYFRTCQKLKCIIWFTLFKAVLCCILSWHDKIVKILT